MKIALLLSLFPFLSFSQTDTIRLLKSYNFHISIANIQLGEIPYWKLCDSAGMTTSENCSILSYDISYFGKAGWTEKHVIGKQVPAEVCTEIGVFGINNMMFFTNIKAMSHDSYRVIFLSPMNLMPVKTDE